MEVDGEETAHTTKGLPSHPGAQEALFFIQKADEALEALPPNFDLALKFLEKGVQLHPRHPVLLQRLAGEYAERGEAEKAKALLRTAIAEEPHTEPSKYLQLAQLEEGQESLSLLDQGIAILEKRLGEHRENRRRMKCLKKGKKKLKFLAECLRDTQDSLASAYAARAELFMTDLCDSPEAEENAEKSVSKALELSPSHPEALLSCAQLRKVKDDQEGACQAARQLFATLETARQKVVKDGFFKEQPAAANECGGGEDISIEVRVNASRVFLDVGMVEEALCVLQWCLEEDDEDPQVWLIFSCALFKSGEFSSAQEALLELQSRINRCGLPSNHPLAVHCKELEAKVQEQLGRSEDTCISEESNSASAPSDDESESQEMAVEE